MSERATLTITVQRRDTRGHYQPMPRAIRRPTSAGTHRLSFRARLRGRPLRPGHYQLALRATDTADNHSITHRVRFVVLRGR